MAYDIELRKKVLNYIGKGHTLQEAHKVFEVGTTTIKEWKKLQKETGKLEKRPLHRKNRKVDPVKLETYISEHPDSYLREIAEVFDCHETTIFYAFKRLKITRKKNHIVCGKE